MKEETALLSIRGRTIEWRSDPSHRSQFVFTRAGSPCAEIKAGDSLPFSYEGKTSEGAWLCRVEGMLRSSLVTYEGNTGQRVATLKLTARIEGEWSFSSGAIYHLELTSQIPEKCRILTEAKDPIALFSPLPTGFKSLFSNSGQIEIEYGALNLPELPVLLLSTWAAIQEGGRFNG